MRTIVLVLGLVLAGCAGGDDDGEAERGDGGPSSSSAGSTASEYGDVIVEVSGDMYEGTVWQCQCVTRFDTERAAKGYPLDFTTPADFGTMKLQACTYTGASADEIVTALCDASEPFCGCECCQAQERRGGARTCATGAEPFSDGLAPGQCRITHD